jgi:hypothetical protein
MTMDQMQLYLVFTIVFGILVFITFLGYIASHVEDKMPASITKPPGPVQIHGPLVNVVTSVVVPSPGTLKQQISETLLVFRTYEASRRSLIGRWMNAEKVTFSTAMTGHRFREIVIMPYETDSKVEQEMIDEYIRDHLPTLLKPGGTIINMNDPGPDDAKDQ